MADSNEEILEFYPDLPKTFEIVEHSSLKDLEGIHCLICDFTSWNPNDILYQYCGKCHQYHHILKLQLHHKKIQKKGSQ